MRSPHGLGSSYHRSSIAGATVGKDHGHHRHLISWGSTTSDHTHSHIKPLTDRYLMVACYGSRCPLGLPEALGEHPASGLL